MKTAEQFKRLLKNGPNIGPWGIVWSRHYAEATQVWFSNGKNPLDAALSTNMGERQQINVIK